MKLKLKKDKIIWATEFDVGPWLYKSIVLLCPLVNNNIPIQTPWLLPDNLWPRSIDYWHGIGLDQPITGVGNNTPWCLAECGQSILSQHKGLAINPSWVEGQTEAAQQRSTGFIQVLDGCDPKALFTLTMSSRGAMGWGGSRSHLVNGRTFTGSPIFNLEFVLVCLDSHTKYHRLGFISDRSIYIFSHGSGG
jgi:hypothetical protein